MKINRTDKVRLKAGAESRRADELYWSERKRTSTVRIDLINNNGTFNFTGSGGYSYYGRIKDIVGVIS